MLEAMCDVRRRVFPEGQSRASRQIAHQVARQSVRVNGVHCSANRAPAAIIRVILTASEPRLRSESVFPQVSGNVKRNEGSERFLKKEYPERGYSPNPALHPLTSSV